MAGRRATGTCCTFSTRKRSCATLHARTSPSSARTNGSAGSTPTDTTCTSPPSYALATRCGRESLREPRCSRDTDERLPPSLAACEVCARNGVGTNELYVWLDYHSIQQKNRKAQLLAISSLPYYAAVMRCFVVIAPTTHHQDTKAPHESYKWQQRSRGDCSKRDTVVTGGVRPDHVFATRLVPPRVLGAHGGWRPRADVHL